MSLSDVHDELRAVARDLLGTAGTDWRLIADSGWLGLEAPQALGGADATFAEVAIILGEMGRAAACGPYLGAAVLGIGALTLLEPGPGRDGLLREAISGTTIPVTAFGGEGTAIPFRLVRTPGGLRLDGSAAFVLDAAEADRLLIPALDPDGTPVIVDAGPGLSVTGQPVVDATRSFGHVVADGVRPEAVWRFRGDPGDALRRLHDRAAVAVACDSLGVSEAMLDATVAYAGVREQFGRKIGSFQAVKHACADMLVQVEVSRRLVSAAARALTEDEAGVPASMAKSYACAAAVEVAGSAMQLHGGLGYTWESGIHVYLKRAVLNRSLFGSPALHRRRLAGRYRKE